MQNSHLARTFTNQRTGKLARLVFICLPTTGARKFTAPLSATRDLKFEGVVTVLGSKLAIAGTAFQDS